MRGSAGPRPAGEYDRGPSPPRDRRRGFGGPPGGGQWGGGPPRGGYGPHPDQGVPIPTDTAGHRPRRGTIAGTAETGAAQSGERPSAPGTVPVKVASDAHCEHYRRTLSIPRTVIRESLSVSLLLHVLGVLRGRQGGARRGLTRAGASLPRGDPVPHLAVQVRHPGRHPGRHPRGHPRGHRRVGLGDFLAREPPVCPRSCSAVSRSPGSDLSRAWITRFASGEMLLHTGFSYSLCRVTSMRLRSPSDSLLASNR